MKILIIEDNAQVSALLKRGLESQGYQIYISEDAEDALVLADRICIRPDHYGYYASADERD